MTTRPRKALPAREPSKEALQQHLRALQFSGWAWRLALRTVLREVEVVGRENLPAGPCLVLMNHSHVLDPLVLALHIGRPLHFLITEPAMFEGWKARLLAALGQIPKRKLETETRSLRLMKKWSKVGASVAMFPEGHFSWDGRPLPLQPGLLHLVHYLDLPVVTIRQINGDRFWPPWASHPRRTKVRLEIDEPLRFEDGDPVDEIIAERIAVDPKQCARFPVRGFRLASGLARLFDLCPDCGARGVLADAGNHLHCRSCQRDWRVGADNRLRASDEQFGVGEALELVYEHLRGQWGRSSGGAVRFESRGEVEVMDATGDEWVTNARGTLLLRDGALQVGSWRLELEELLAHTIDFGHLLLLRTAKRRIAIKMSEDSRALWTFAIDEEMTRYREKSA